MSFSDSVNNTISDLEYIGLEIEALGPLIESIPCKIKPMGESSIAELLHTICKNQNFASKVIDKILQSGDKSQFDESILDDKIELTEEELADLSLEETLIEIKYKRKKLVDTLRSQSKSFFKVELFDGMDIHNLLNKLVKKERYFIQQIGEIVKTIQSDKQFQRELRTHKHS